MYGKIIEEIFMNVCMCMWWGGQGACGGEGGGVGVGEGGGMWWGGWGACGGEGREHVVGRVGEGKRWGEYGIAIVEKLGDLKESR